MKDLDTTKMKAKLDAFFETATQQDISALLRRTNYDFYKNVEAPEDWFDTDFAVTEVAGLILELPIMAASYPRVTNRPIVYIGRGYPDHRVALAADHEDLALAA